METKNRAYGHLILTMFLVGVLGSVVALRFHGVNISPFVFLVLPICVSFSLKSMIKYFKDAFKL